MPSFGERIKHAWNAFLGRDPTRISYENWGPAYYSNPYRTRLSRGNERSIVTAIYNRISMDVAAVDIRHCMIDENGNYAEDINDGLNQCLTLSANIDQTSRAFIQDVVLSMFDEGCVAIIINEADKDPMETESYDIGSLRVGRITQWYPDAVEVEAYDERDGRRKRRVFPKSITSIIENPFYAVMNEPNSTLQRLIRKLNILDAIDEQSGSGKLDLIIQMPYGLRSETQRQQAEERRKDIEMQLSGSRYGIAYASATERITQLNRAVDNQIMTQIEYLTSMLYSQLGTSREVFEGTADEAAMLNYNNRTIEPILSAITLEMKRKFLTTNARTRGHSIEYIRNPFRLVPVSQVAEIADKFTRAEALSPNEIRGIIGYRPSKDPRSDELRNRNLNQSDAEVGNPVKATSDEQR